MVKYGVGKAGGVVAIGAILIIGIGRYVVQQLTRADPAVVTRITVSDDAEMVIGASAEGTETVAFAAILVAGRTRIVRIGWHVRIERRRKWFACGSNLRWDWIVIAMAGLAVVDDTVMIESECRGEALGVMARSTIGGGCRVGRHRGRLRRCVNTGAVVVA